MDKQELTKKINFIHSVNLLLHNYSLISSNTDYSYVVFYKDTDRIYNGKTVTAIEEFLLQRVNGVVTYAVGCNINSDKANLLTLVQIIKGEHPYDATDYYKTYADEKNGYTFLNAEMEDDASFVWVVHQRWDEDFGYGDCTNIFNTKEKAKAFMKEQIEQVADKHPNMWDEYNEDDDDYSYAAGDYDKDDDYWLNIEITRERIQ